MTNNLKEYFPLIRERNEVLADINSKQSFRNVFDGWKKEQQEEFLDFCTGVKGVKILNDSFFKEVMNPEYAPERLNDFLSTILKQRVKVLHVLPNDSVRLASEGSLLITDLVVELEDGSIVNVEVQRIGYKFPGERAACYSADMLLRQYKRVREMKGKAFTYKNIKPVYTIVLFEKSPMEFHKCKEDYLHYVEAKADTELEINLLQKYIFVSLDIFAKTRHNKSISNKTDAWLTFFSTDNPEEIIELITAYPEFQPMYDNIYELCRNIERVINMFSKELQMLDENTVQYMMDEMQEEIDNLQEKVDGLQEELDVKSQSVIAKDKAIDEKEKAIVAKDKVIDEKEKAIVAKDKVIDEKEKAIVAKDKVIDEKEKAIVAKDKTIAEKDKLIQQLQEQLKAIEN